MEKCSPTFGKCSHRNTKWFCSILINGKNHPEQGRRTLAQATQEGAWGRSCSSQMHPLHSRGRNLETWTMEGQNLREKKWRAWKQELIVQWDNMFIHSMNLTRCIGSCREKSFYTLCSVYMASNPKNCFVLSWEEETVVRSSAKGKVDWVRLPEKWWYNSHKTMYPTRGMETEKINTVITYRQYNCLPSKFKRLN